ncbi:hypothetical protein D3C76_1101130 [compost metagenome]
MRALRHFEVLSTDKVVGPVILDLRLKRDDSGAAELVVLVQWCPEQRVIQRRRSCCDLSGAFTAVLTSQGRTLGNKAFAGVKPTALLKITLGQGALAIVIAQLVVGE